MQIHQFYIILVFCTLYRKCMAQFVWYIFMRLVLDSHKHMHKNITLWYYTCIVYIYSTVLAMQLIYNVSQMGGGG